jgi:Secretion system C-terminal sorting domain
MRHFELHPPTSVETPNNSAEINVFPNSSNGLVFLDFPDGRARQYQLFDATGKLLETNTGNAISLMNLAQGLYFIRIENRAFRVIKK